MSLSRSCLQMDKENQQPETKIQTMVSKAPVLDVVDKDGKRLLKALSGTTSAWGSQSNIITGFSAWIVANGKPLPEHLVAVDEVKHQVSCWIPSETNQAFAVYWQDYDSGIDTCSFITLDGFTVPGRFLFGTGSTYRSGVRSSKDTEKSFVFQQLSKEQAGSNPMMMRKDVGMITLRIKRVSRVSSRPANTLQSIPPPPPRSPGEMQISYGKEVSTFQQHDNTWTVKAYEGRAENTKPSTYVSFVFRYRSREFLISQGIMPAPDPQPLTRESSSTSVGTSPMRRVTSAPVDPSSFISSPSPPSSTPESSPLRSSPLVLSSPPSLQSPQLEASEPQLELEPHRPAKVNLYKDSRRPNVASRRIVSMKEAPYKPTGGPGQGLIRFI